MAVSETCICDAMTTTRNLQQQPTFLIPKRACSQIGRVSAPPFAELGTVLQRLLVPPISQ
eukprot:674752-Prorocentrum_lima.AAC.1